MKHFVLCLVLTATIAGCSSASAPADDAQPQALPILPTLPADASAEITAFLDGTVSSGGVPKAVAVVANREGVIFEGTFGKQRVEDDIDVALDSIFNLASMTKPVTSVAVLMLAEEGAFDFDDPVSDYLPEMADQEVLRELDAEAGTYATEPAAGEITIRQLLTHTSGQANGFNSPEAQAVAQILGPGNASEVPLVAHPGTEWNYSPATTVLGHLVEEVSGMGLDRYFATRIFDPLGMVDTTYAVPGEKRDRVVTVHTGPELTEGAIPETVGSAVNGAGGLYGTAPDYIRFLRMILNEGELDGVRILSPESVALMLTNQMGEIRVQNQVSTNPALSADFPRGVGTDTWGFGFQLAGSNANPNLRAPGSFSWAGIFNTHFWGDPERGIVAVLLMQQLPFYSEEAMAAYQGFEERVNAGLKP